MHKTATNDTNRCRLRVRCTGLSMLQKFQKAEQDVGLSTFFLLQRRYMTNRPSAGRETVVKNNANRNFFFFSGQQIELASG